MQKSSCSNDYQVDTPCGRSEQVPEDWRKAAIVPLHKKKDQSFCENRRGISLLGVAGKVFTIMLLTMLVLVTDSKISGSLDCLKRAVN